jgi:hypothetical protein
MVGRKYLSFNFTMIVAMLFFIASCNFGKDKSAEDMLEQMKINQTAYLAMSPCRQIEVYAEVGSRFLDMGQMGAVVPDWMDSALANQPLDEIADCISKEGLLQIENMSLEPDSRQDVSLRIHALVYKASELDLLDKPKILELLDISVCKSELDYPYILVRTYYLEQFGKLPDYYADDSDKRMEIMKVELCDH